jgi:aspartate/methionine/tyrosine aminotransferase
MIGEPSPLVVAHFKCADDKFCPDTNPDGKINLGTAENHLMDDEMLAMVNRPTPFSTEHLHYGELHGASSFRAAIATLLEEDLKISAVNPDNIVVASGSSAILESIAMALFEDGDGLIVPAPFYSGFTHDFSTRFNVKLLPYGLSADNNYELDIDGLETAVSQAKQTGITVKAILICSPHNPLGITYTNETLEQVVQLAEAHNLDIIADEIYAQSVYSGQFKSMLEIGKAYRQHIHFTYGFAKDFALSGFKTGVFYSENKELVTAVQEIAYFHAVSTHTQRFLETLIADRTWRKAFIEENKRKLLFPIKNFK